MTKNEAELDEQEETNKRLYLHILHKKSVTLCRPPIHVIQRLAQKKTFE